MTYYEGEEDLTPLQVRAMRVQREFEKVSAASRKGNKVRLAKLAILNAERAANVVEWEWAGLKNRDMAAKFGITEASFINWKTNHRDLINLEYDKLEKQLNQDRSIRRLKAKDEVGKRLDMALSAVDSCLVAESEAVRSKTALAVLDRIDPISKQEVNVTLGVFSSKTAGLLQAALPIDAEEAELVGEEDETV